MHHVSSIASGPWLWPAFFILLIVAVVGLIIYSVSKKRKTSNVSTEADEEELGWEFCPDIMVELYQLRKELKNLKATSSSSQS